MTIIESESIKQRTQILEDYYAKYLLYSRGLKQVSVNKYQGALRYISKVLIEKQLIKTDIYEVNNLKQLQHLSDILHADKDFIEKDQRGNHMYSSGLKNYISFASGDWTVKQQMVPELFDSPIKAGNVRQTTIDRYDRNNIIKNHVIQMSDYKCEMDGSHYSFVAQVNNKPYMEGHHLIPLRRQELFINSLDVYSNVVCLCPLCHRKIHYGLNNERKYMINRLYESRSPRLEKSGIYLSAKDLCDLALSL